LREFSEELGVGAERVRIVGRLPDLQQVSNRFIITPIVGVLDPQTRFSVDGEEVVGVITVPLEALVANDAIREGAFNYEGRRIWGFTARILKSFVDAWNEPASALRAAVESAIPGGAGRSPFQR
jgi:8-oxo-dGTP pyrophosphatase MutT (NUDIX family)